MSLLVVAAGDARTIPETVNIVNNAAFRYCLELLGNFHRFVHGSKDDLLARLLVDYKDDGDFFIFCGRLLDAIDQRVRGRHREFRRASGDEPSTYDHAAYLALGQTLCRVGGVRGAKFPTTSQCFSELVRQKPQVLQQVFLTNYLGNVLQDYLDASRVRARFSSLPPDIEEKLRNEDAAALSKEVFAQLGKGDGPVDQKALQNELRDLISRVWLAEQALND